METLRTSGASIGGHGKQNELLIPIHIYSFIFLKYFLLFRYFKNSIQSTEPTVAIRIAVIAFHDKAVVLKMDCKKGTYTINICRMTVSTMAPHNSLFANILEENSEL